MSPLSVVTPHYKLPPDPNSAFYPADLIDYSIKGPATELVTFTNGDGETIDLSTIPDIQYKESMDGRFMPPTQHFSDSTPGQDGAVYRSTTTLPNQVTVYLLIVADDVTTLRTRIRELGTYLNPKLGVGTLRVSTNDGLTRYVSCVCEPGMTTDPATDGFQYQQKLALVFRAFDPYWYEDVPVNRPFSNTSTVTAFFPIFPVRLGASNIFSITEENNLGDVKAWPIWTIKGPGQGLTLKNDTTNESLVLNYSLPTGAQVEIDTRPGVKSVLAERSISIFGSVSGDLWAIAKGRNAITVLLSNTDNATEVTLSYQRRYLGI